MITPTIYESGRLVVACLSGVVTMREIESYFYWLVDNFDTRISPGFSQLVYADNLQTIDVALKDFHRLSQLNATVGRKRGSFDSAIVVPDIRYYWMAKLHKTLSRNADINTRIFRDIDAAFLWLGYRNPLGLPPASSVNE